MTQSSASPLSRTSASSTVYDAVVLGAGIYGCKVALELASLGMKVLVADPNGVMNGATKVNQNRVHAGYHYPRSAATAATAAKHYRRFLIDHAPAVTGNYRHLYCIANDSKVKADDYERVMREIGAPMTRVDTPSYFTPGLIEQAFETHERSFNILELRAMLRYQLKVARIEMVREHGSVVDVDDNFVTVNVGQMTLITRYLFNCTYSAIDSIVPIRTKLIKEHVEVVLVRAPTAVTAEDLTLMDGPYWSLMDYPSEPGISALTHVRLGRHQIWSPPDPEPEWDQKSRWEEMLEDAAQYVPALANAKYCSSMLTTRTLLADQVDDSRPVLVEYSPESARIISVLGSKFNSLYEILDFLRSREWD